MIRGEAMQPGSSFRLKSSMPRCQIPIYTPGILYDTFLGYGIRYDDILVVPVHIFTSADNGMLLKVDEKSYLLEATPIMSEILSDVCYFMMDKSVWARFGVQSARVAGAPISPVAVTVVGPQGASSGYVSRNATPYILNYTGSTIPGYSGAPYVCNGSVIGIHAGETNGTNVGYGMGAIATEISVLIYGEDFEDYNFESKSRRRTGNAQFAGGHWKKGNNKYNKNREPEQPWRDADVAKNVKQARGDAGPASNWDDFTGRDTFDYDQVINFNSANSLPEELVEAFSDYSVAQLESIRNYLDGLTQVQKSTGVRIRPHGVEGFDFVDVVSEPTASTSYVVSWQERMEERVTKLEMQLASLVKRQTNVVTKKPFPCDKCDKSFSSKLGKVSHEITKHAELTPETAVRGDEDVPVATKPISFLGKGRTQTSTNNSHLKKKSVSISSSPSLPMTDRSSQSSKSLPKMKASRQDIVKAFESFQQAIFGLLEDQKQ